MVAGERPSNGIVDRRGDKNGLGTAAISLENCSSFTGCELWVKQRGIIQSAANLSSTSLELFDRSLQVELFGHSNRLAIRMVTIETYRSAQSAYSRADQ